MFALGVFFSVFACQMLDSTASDSTSPDHVATTCEKSSFSCAERFKAVPDVLFCTRTALFQLVAAALMVFAVLIPGVGIDSTEGPGEKMSDLWQGLKAAIFASRNFSWSQSLSIMGMFACDAVALFVLVRLARRDSDPVRVPNQLHLTFADECECVCSGEWASRVPEALGSPPCCATSSRTSIRARFRWS